MRLIFQPKGKDAKPSLIVGSYDFKLYAFDPVTGKKKWDYETSNYINGSPAVFSGRTAFGGCDALLHVIDLNAGKKQKQIDAEAYIIGSAAVVDDMAYIGHYENEFLASTSTAVRSRGSTRTGRLPTPRRRR